MKFTSLYLIYFILLFICLFLDLSPGLALILGIFISYCNLNPSPEVSKKFSKYILAWSIIGLGATVKIYSVYEVSVSSFKLTIITLFVTIAGGWVIGSFLGVTNKLRALISSGTAICGATAIAAVGETLNAKKEEISLALGVILILNGIALFLFPFLGHIMQLTPQQFGVWAGLAIHDTSSVIGAALEFSPDSVEVATTVKLARAVWIAPITILFSYLLKANDGKMSFKLPWFIGGFIASAALFSFAPGLSVYVNSVGFIARKGFIMAIFLLGSTINIVSLKELGIIPLVFGVILWIISCIVSLAGILW